MSDRELLEAAARAAGIVVIRPRLDDPMHGDLLIEQSARNPHQKAGPWNALTDDGDALRLAAHLCMNVKHDDPNAVIVGWSELQRTPITHDQRGPWHWKEWLRDHGNDRAATSRRAIVRAAATLGGRGT